MEFQTIKGAFIKRSRTFTNIAGGKLRIYQDVSIIHPDSSIELVRNVMFSDYIEGKMELKKAYRIFIVPMSIPVLLFQNGFFIARKVNCVFALYDGRQMREDIENMMNHLRAYRRGVFYASFSLCALGSILGFISAGLIIFLGMFIVAWFLVVLTFSLVLKVDNIQTEMEEFIDMDRNRWDEEEKE